MTIKCKHKKHRLFGNYFMCLDCGVEVGLSSDTIAKSIAAAILNTSRQTIYTMQFDGRLPSRITFESLQPYIGKVNFDEGRLVPIGGIARLLKVDYKLFKSVLEHYGTKMYKHNNGTYITKDNARKILKRWRAMHDNLIKAGIAASSN